MSDTVSVRIPRDLMKELRALEAQTHATRGDALRKALRRGIAAEKLDAAIEAYRRKEISLGRAAEIAGIPMVRMLDEIRRAGVLRDYDLEALREDIEWARSS